MVWWKVPVNKKKKIQTAKYTEQQQQMNIKTPHRRCICLSWVQQSGNWCRFSSTLFLVLLFYPIKTELFFPPFQQNGSHLFFFMELNELDVFFHSHRWTGFLCIYFQKMYQFNKRVDYTWNENDRLYIIRISYYFASNLYVSWFTLNTYGRYRLCYIPLRFIYRIELL